MSHEVTVHAAQTLILRELLFRPSAGFAELQKPTGLSSDHFNFHIKKLLELGLVDRVGRGKYQLSTKGKEYANRLDTDNNTVERQPKVAVVLAVERMADGRTEMIFQERLKQPYYGYWGLPTGKIRWGETIFQAAARELHEETGLEADFELGGTYHEHAVSKETGELLEDKIFYAFHGTNPRGEMKEQFDGGRNEWMSREEVKRRGKTYGSFDSELDLALGKRGLLLEEIHEVSAEDF